MNRRRDRLPKAGNVVGDLLWIVAGCVCVALGFRLFLNGNQLATGGVVGLSTIVESWTGIGAAWVQWSVNIPLLLIGFRVLGAGSGFRGVLGSLLLPLLILIFSGIRPVTDDLLLASVFGGALYGTGIGFIFWGGGSVGGFTLLAQMAARFLPLKRGSVMLLLDALVLAGAALEFGTERALWGALGSWATRQVVDAVLAGFTDARAAWIVTDKDDAVREWVLRELDRGATLVPAEGAYTGNRRRLIVTIVSPGELVRLRERIRGIDPDAFVFFTPAGEVLGKGFHSLR